jgi:error-prone DNA polymerase
MALWLLGAVAPGERLEEGTQLALPLEPENAPALPELTRWDRMVADYGSTAITLREHPLELLRPGLDGAATSRDLERIPHGRRVKVAGLVVARQRPATANGMTFMLLEDEFGTINLIVSPPVHDAHRLAVRAEPLITAEGQLEHREGTMNVVVDRVGRLERPDLPLGEVRHIEPSRWGEAPEVPRGAEPPVSSEAGEEVAAAADADDLRAVAPAAHSFGRRGR